jgi:alkanesulfonate monooxygenase SsuD/methylene tetrahydromethanopterin reductase-like flavin-dependent oxidoreductase (luciferase family)
MELKDPLWQTTVPGQIRQTKPPRFTGGSQQSPDWLCSNGDGWMTYPRHPNMQARVIQDWRANIAAKGSGPKPVMQPLYVDLVDDADAPAQPIHLGFRSGSRALLAHLGFLEACGVNHVTINLRFNQADPEETIDRLAREVLPEFSS